MRAPAQLVIGILLTHSAQAWGQQITGRIYPQKESYLVGEPVFVVLDLKNPGPESVRVDDGNCWFSTEFEALTPMQDREVSLYGCSGGGVAGDCLGSVVELRPGQDRKRLHLLGGPFRFASAGVYSIRARYAVQIYRNDETSSALLSTEEIISDLEVSLRQSDESELASAYQPVLRELENPDPLARGLAISAITQNPRRFLEKVILALTDDPQTVGASIVGLKGLATPQAKAKLAQLAGATNPESIRQQAVTALGELGDPSYCRLLLEIAQGRTEYSGLTALRAVGFVCEKEALATLVGALPNGNPSLRYELAYALGNTRTREAVPILISLLVDADENVRRAAAEALVTLTHRTSTKDIRDEASARRIYLDWMKWWSFNGRTTPIYSIRQCDGLRPID